MQARQRAPQCCADDVRPPKQGGSAPECESRVRECVLGVKETRNSSPIVIASTDTASASVTHIDAFVPKHGHGPLHVRAVNAKKSDHQCKERAYGGLGSYLHTASPRVESRSGIKARLELRIPAQVLRSR